MCMYMLTVTAPPVWVSMRPMPNYLSQMMIRMSGSNGLLLTPLSLEAHERSSHGTVLLCSRLATASVYGGRRCRCSFICSRQDSVDHQFVPRNSRPGTVPLNPASNEVSRLKGTHTHYTRTGTSFLVWHSHVRSVHLCGCATPAS